MADESPAEPPLPDDATIVKRQGADDATIVKGAAAEDDATVMAGRDMSMPAPSADRAPAVVSEALAAQGLPDSEDMGDATVAASGSEARTVTPEGAGDHTVARPAAGAEGTMGPTATARETKGWTGTVPASERVNVPAGGSSRPVVQGVVLGAITGLLLFAATAWWLLHGR